MLRRSQALHVNSMGFGNIFVATTLAPCVLVLASVSLQLFKIGLEFVGKSEFHSADSSVYTAVQQ